MTNETALAATHITDGLCRAFVEHHGNTAAIRNQALSWLAEHGFALIVNIVASLVILCVGWLVIRLLVALIGHAIKKRGPNQALFGLFIQSVTTKVCWTLLLVIILSKLGINVAPIIAGLGVSGFVLGFAFQESLSNLAAGLMIAFNEPFKLGDYVIIAGYEGFVRKMDMIATVLATRDNKKIIIANKSVWSAPITNFTALGCRRVDIPIGISYACDVTKAIKVAVETLPNVAGVLDNPPPDVIVASLDNSQVTLNVRPWTKGLDFWAVRSSTQIAIKDAFEKNGISIPFPQLDVHLDR